MVKLWKQWCRLCAREDLSGCHFNIFLKDEEISLLSETINKCFSINITCQDEWPQSICAKCHQLVTAIISFGQRASKVQAMFAELYNSLEEIDAGKLKVQYELQELGDVELELKLFANSPGVNLFESKPPMASDITEQMIDLDELEYIDEAMFNANNIKTENAEDESVVACDEDWKDQLASAGEDDSDEGETKKQESESENTPSKSEKKKRLRRQETSTYNCNDCNKKYKRFTNYRLHMQTEHAVALQPPQFSCIECNKSFATAGRLQDHETTHLPLDQKLKIPCLYCDKMFSKQAVVQSHVRAVHMDEKLFVCEECGKKYKTFGSLKEHKVSHTEERLFKCSWCDKTFKSKLTLKVHEDTHNETKYICTTCGLQLNTRRTLRMHMVVHSDQKRHKCDYCGNEYKRAKALKNHLILHTGLKPYTCNFCEKTFANGSNCRSHKKKTHPVELAAMEAAGTKAVTANIPKLEHLRAATSSRYETLPDGKLSKEQNEIAHEVFRETMSAS